jgi:transposase InsO family protein
VSLREQHPAWGARKIAACLQRRGIIPPAASTITRILHRPGLIDMTESQKHQAWKRFVHEKPNDLWQMDFKGDVALDKGRCHPLTVLDDHSRFSLGLVACANEQTVTVRSALTTIFRSYGLPLRMTMDNGSPWGNTKENPYTALTVWLMRLGIRISHSRPYHPQTQGKDERFHRTLKAEVLSRTALNNLGDAQQQFDTWRSIYNTERPHEALGMDVPAQHYQASALPFPEHILPIEYPDGAYVRSVQLDGAFSISGRTAYVSKAFAGWKIAIIETHTDGCFDVYFCQNKITTLNYNDLPRTK